MIKKEITGLVLSDIHLGNTRNKASEITFKLKTEISKHPSIDILIIAGDLYDRILSLGSEDAIQSLLFAKWLVRFCKENNVILRILEGTPSHDFKQPLMIASLYDDTEGLDFRYISDIEVEHIATLGLNILYVQDEARNTIEETMHDIHKAKGDAVVHIAVLHGQFHYQLPFELESSFNESDFDFVKYLIFIGHVHIYNPKGKIIPQGSFDRLTFGDEAPKGYVRFRIHPLTGASYVFIENKAAKKFDTIDIRTGDANKASHQLLRKIANYDSEYLRVVVHDESLDTTVLTEVARKNNIILTIKKHKKELVLSEEDKEIAISTQFSITPDNVKRLIENRVGELGDDTDRFDNEMMNLLS